MESQRPAHMWLSAAERPGYPSANMKLESCMGRSINNERRRPQSGLNHPDEEALNVKCGAGVVCAAKQIASHFRHNEPLGAHQCIARTQKQGGSHSPLHSY